MRPGDRVEPLEDLGLGVDHFGDRLDHVVDVGQRVEIGSGREPAQRRVAVRRRQLALLDELAEALLDAPARALDGRGDHVAQPHLEPRLREHLGDAVAHGARADDAYSFDVHLCLSRFRLKAEATRFNDSA